jgi:hypothetical protein
MKKLSKRAAEAFKYSWQNPYYENMRSSSFMGRFYWFFMENGKVVDWSAKYLKKGQW